MDIFHQKTVLHPLTQSIENKQKEHPHGRRRSCQDSVLSVAIGGMGFDVNPLYLAHYLDNLRQIRSSLSGHSDASLSPSFIPPTGCWTLQEKDRFFHALSIYSRLRPDLIADHVKTKSTVDVCNYLDSLEEAASGAQSCESPNTRSNAGAIEVSMQWIQFEENRAAEIVAAEGHWDDIALLQKRNDEAQDYKKFLRAERRRVREGPGDEAFKRSQARKLAFKPWREKQGERWKKEDLCKALDNHDLVAIGMILRDAEKTSAATEQDSAENTPSQQIATSPHTSLVGPSSQPTLPAKKIIEANIDPVFPDNAAVGERSLSNSLVKSPLCSANLVPTDLSPASRRRYQKRLHMRRKRAQLSGRAVDEKVHKLKPGRKSKSKEIVNTRLTCEGAVGDTHTEEINADEEEDTEGNHHHPHVSGKTLPYKTVAKFKEAGIDTEALGELGLDLFSPGKLSKFMNLYALLDEGAPAAISYETIELLRAHVVHFVTDLLHQTIVSREQEQFMKNHTKAWKISNEKVITKENVDQALLQMMGFPKPGDKQGYLSRLMKRFDAAGDKQCSRNSEDDDSDDVGDVGDVDDPSDDEYDNDGTGFTSPVKREQDPDREGRSYPSPSNWTRPAFIRLPASFDDDDSLVPEVMDEDQLISELLEEEELDKMDCLLDKAEEKKLRSQFGCAAEMTTWME